MQLQLDDLKSPVFLTGLAVVLGTVFQFGYFRNLGTEFIYLLGPTDWIVSLMILSLPILTMGAITVFLCQWLGDGYALAISTRVGRFIIGLPILLIWYFSFVALSTLYSSYPASGPWLTIGFGLLLIAVTVVCLRNLLDEYEIDLAVVALLAIAWVSYVHFLGKTYALIGGRVCKIEFVDNRVLTAVYMRPLGGGHLYRLNGSTYFSSGSEVREIKCTWADNTWEQQIRLLGG